MSEDLGSRFIEHGEAEASELVRAMLDAGEAATLAEALIAELAGEALWRRERILDLLIHIPESKVLLPFFAEALHEDSRADRRNGARSALTLLASPASAICADAVVVLADLALKPKDTDVRLLAAAALGESGNGRARPALESALRDTDVNVSSAAAESLGMIGDRRAVGPLLDALATSGFWTRAAAIMALGTLRDPRAIPALTQLLSDPLLASAAATSLGDIGAPESLGPLTDLLDGAPETRSEALDAIAKLYAETPTLDLPDEVCAKIGQSREHLLQRFKGGDDILAARLLGIGADERLADMLIAAAGAEGTRLAAQVGLSSIKPARRLRLLLPRLKSVGPEMRAMIIGLLPPLGSSADVEQLIPLLAEESLEVRSAASRILGASDPELVKAALNAALREPHLRTGAAIALSSVVDKPADLASLLDDDEPSIRFAAADALGRMGGTIPELMRRLAEEADPAVRQRLIVALGRSGGEESVPPLVRILETGDPGEKFAAARALGATGSEDALAPLLTALDDSAGEIRIAALTALGELGDTRAMPAVEGHLGGDQSRDVRRMAARAFDRLADAGALARLAGALDDPDREVRLTAVSTLRRLGSTAALEALETRADVEADADVRAAATRAVVELRDQQGSAEG